MFVTNDLKIQILSFIILKDVDYWEKNKTKADRS